MENRYEACVVPFQRNSVNGKSEGTSNQKYDGSSAHPHSALILSAGEDTERHSGAALPQSAKPDVNSPFSLLWTALEETRHARQLSEPQFHHYLKTEQRNRNYFNL